MTTLQSALRAGRLSWLLRGLLWTVALSLAWLQVSPSYAAAHAVVREDARRAAWLHAHTPHVKLPPGLTQTPDAALRAKINAKQAAAAARPAADVRPLSAKEMGYLTGRGPLRNPYFNGTLPWQRSLRDVNLCNGNLFKSFTDIQVAPARGAGLVLQRTYNSNDARIGPFGVGWTHAYDIRIQEAADVQAESGDPAADGTADDVPRTDFFGAKHTYHRDADGLYSPPSYMFDETDSDYDSALINGPTKVMADTEKGEDGTVKHYVNVVTLADGTEGNERACDYIQDRHGNTTSLTYGQPYVQPDGSTRKLLTQVADPSGRSLVFAWTNLGTTAQPAYRITQVQGPLVNGSPVAGVTYMVSYAYYTDPNEANAANDLFNLKSVTLDAGDSSHLNRTTTYTYTACTGTYYDQQGGAQSATENGLLQSVADPLGHTVSYQYSGQMWSGTIWVTQINEPGSGGTHTWHLYGTAPYMSSHFVGYTMFIDDASSGYDSIGLHVGAGFDNRLRTVCLFAGQQDQDDVWDYAYDDSNNVTQKNSGYDPGASAETITYGTHGNALTEQTGGQIQSISGGVIGWPVWQHGTTTTWYNASQYFQKSGVTDALGHTTAMGVGTSTDANSGNKGEVLWVQDAGYSDSSSPSYQKQFTYTYNQYGQKTSETNLNGVVTQYTYDDQWGNLTQVVQDPGGTGHLNRTTAMTYDAAGRVLQSTDPAGQTSTFAYNILGQPLAVATPAKGNAPAETISYAYDTNGRTHSVTDNRGMTTMAYLDGTDMVSSVTDPVTGTTRYTYRLSGERKTMTLPGGGTWTYTYVADINAAGGSSLGCNETLPKDDPNSITSTLASITDDQGRQVRYLTGYTGQLTASMSDQTFDAQGNAVSYVLTTYKLPTGDEYNNAPPNWAPAGEMEGVTTTFVRNDTPGGSPSWHSRLLSSNAYTYNDLGERLTNTVTTASVNADGSPQYTGGSPVYGNPPSYNAPMPATNQVTTTRTEAYSYEALSRLSTVDYGDGQTQSYTFDAMGNRLSRQDSVAGTTNYAYDAANRLTGTTGAGADTYANDADGNTLTGGARTNTWDSQNRLVNCTKSSPTGTGTTTFYGAYTYGADGLRRRATTYSATRYPGRISPPPPSPLITDYAYDGTMLVREGRAKSVNGVSSLQPNVSGQQASITATYFLGARGPEYRRDDTKTETDSQGRTVTKARWYVYDGLGSVVGEVDPSGNLTSSPKYDVYGAVRANGGSATSRQGLVGSLGHVSDDTGLTYMRARYYDPSTGRFISQDPAGDGVNWFLYADNNPVNVVDRSGRGAERLAFAIIAEILGATIGAVNNTPIVPAAIQPYINAIDCISEMLSTDALRIELLATLGAKTDKAGAYRAGYNALGNGAIAILACVAVYQIHLIEQMIETDCEEDPNKVH